MKTLLIVKCGGTLPALRARRGDYEDWILSGMGLAPERARIAAVSEGEELPAPAELQAAVFTGSSAMVSARAPWSERSIRWSACRHWHCPTRVRSRHWVGCGKARGW